MMREFWIKLATQTDDDYIAKLASGRVVAITDALGIMDRRKQH